MNSHFIEQMIRHLGSKPCPKGLVQGWRQLEQALAAAATQRQWQVIQWPTGSGKTEALTVLCATPEVTRHPGALVVTKFTNEADEIVRKINANAGSTIAVTTHQKKAPLTERAMTESPVLVITHEAYRSALREASDRPDAAVRLNLYHRYFHSDRSWIVIDEAFNWIDAYETDLDDVSAMCAALSVHLRDEVDLAQLSSWAHQLGIEQDAPRSDRLLSDEHFAMLGTIDFGRLRTAIKDIPAELIELWRNTGLLLRTSEAPSSDTESKRTSFRNQYLALLNDLDAITRIGHCWISQRRSRTRIHSSRLLLDTNRSCGLILDATATIDRTYDLLGERVVIMPRPTSFRSYNKLTVHVSRPHSVGKEYLAKHGSSEWPIVAKQLSNMLSEESDVLIVTQKSTKRALVCKLRCNKQGIGHWGDLDGKNDWRHSDTVVIFGLPYPDDIAPTDAFQACTGLLSVDWFAGKREYGGHADVRAALKYGFIARSVIQAINRARCRTITDNEGNCAKTDVFILLPRGTVGDVVLASMRTEMPGANIVPWTAMRAKDPPATGTEQRLISELRGVIPGIYVKAQMVERLSTTSRTFGRLSVKLRNPSSALARQLAAIGVEFRCTRGRGKEAHFIKH